MSSFPPLIWRAFCVFVFTATLPAQEKPAPPQHLEPGDLVAVCGDSITEQKLYSLFMEDYLVMCQPQPRLQAVQIGWGGERAPGFLDRMANDVLPFHPTVATTCYGMNDGDYGASTPEILDRYRTAMTGTVEAFKAGGVRFILVGSPGVVDTASFKRDAAVYNNTLGELAVIAKEVAAAQGVGFADVHSLMREAMTKAKAQNGDAYFVAGSDGVHPGPNGHLVMAYAYLKGLGCDGAIGTITVDLKSKKATATEGHTIASFAEGTVEIQSTRYPFCFSNSADADTARGILPFLPFNQDLNRFLLVVKGSPAKTLRVTWGEVSKEFPAETLKKGINLAVEFPENPFCEAFFAIERKIRDKQEFETRGIKDMLHSFKAWKSEFPETAPTLHPLVGKVVDKDKALRDNIAKAVVPVSHSLKIEAVN